jgi:hypothetical protein
MPLPKLETPTYELSIPSTKELLKYRPFLVKEEKILLIAQESEEESEILAATKNIIEACTFNKIKCDDLTVYDIEYIFLKIRGKSVGESIEFKGKCQHCPESIDFRVNIDEVEVFFPEAPESKIDLGGGVGLTLKSIKVKDLDKIDESDLISTICSVIDTIYDNENVYTSKDFSEKELHEFVGNLKHEDLEIVQRYIENQPVLKHTISSTCPCDKKKKSTYTLQGLESFFI